MDLEFFPRTAISKPVPDNVESINISFFSYFFKFFLQNCWGHINVQKVQMM